MTTPEQERRRAELEQAHSDWKIVCVNDLSSLLQYGIRRILLTEEQKVSGARQAPLCFSAEHLAKELALQVRLRRTVLGTLFVALWLYGCCTLAWAHRIRAPPPHVSSTASSPWSLVPGHALPHPGRPGHPRQQPAVADGRVATVR